MSHPDRGAAPTHIKLGSLFQLLHAHLSPWIPDPHDDNPAIHAALIASMYTSGVCKIPPDQCYLYLHDAENVAQHAFFLLISDYLNFFSSLNFSAATQDEPARIHKACDPATFRRGSKTILDGTSKSTKLDLSHFATSFELCNTTILERFTTI
ncbi:hypothetical protein IW261DRAFT_672602 [Armillaria novae-zelandiae]|uniref:Uncharacterized protein n=1 Tax=Armillaria novae-zelandiae TaxID=153914 RepID=A0AA39NY23_9AGAR|nr:hypothetical protein IW261DRAFT_672602 [Armillaria novae-zelandiae]